MKWLELSEVLKKLSEESKQNIDKIRDIYKNYNATLEEKDQATRMAEKILSELFDSGYFFCIPYAFMETELGRMIFELKFSNPIYYTLQEISIIMDKKEATIYYNKDNENIDTIKMGGNFVVSENELKKFMRKKKFKESEIELRLKTFNELNNRFKNKQDKSKHDKKDILRKEYNSLIKERLN